VPEVCRSHAGTLRRRWGAENEAVEAPPYSAEAVDVVRLPDRREERDPDAVRLPVDETLLDNVNTPDDLRRLG
jgi:hypothetical protein